MICRNQRQLIALWGCNVKSIQKVVKGIQSKNAEMLDFTGKMSVYHGVRFPYELLTILE